MGTVTLHCKKYVKAYLENKYAKDGVVKLDRRTLLHDLFLNAVGKKYHPTSDFNKKLYDAEVEISIRHNDLSQHGVSLKPSNQHHFNKIIEEKIKNEMFITITCCRFQGMPPGQAYYHTQRAFGFTDETFPLDSFKTVFYRMKEELHRITGVESILKL